MAKITFKNVGQGDSIIIEWADNKINKIGIIDSNLHERKNPVLEHLKLLKYTEIEFFILSHPHYDHFSGINQILEYCEENNIVIKQFRHTCQQIPQYLKPATGTKIHETELVKMFLTIKKMRLNGIILKHSYINDETRDIQLNNSLQLSFLAPSSEEYEQYLKNAPLFNTEERGDNSQANWLSTVIKIHSSESYSLLTSDAAIPTLKRIGITMRKEGSTTLKLAQSPHHGSEKNHYEGFWKTKKREKGTPIIFSVGPNKYKHPSEKTVDFFKSTTNNYEIYSTNLVGGLILFDLKEEIIDSYSEIIGSTKIEPSIKPSKLQGDQTFNLI